MTKLLLALALSLTACGAPARAPETTGTIVMHWTSASRCSYTSPIKITVTGPAVVETYDATCTDYVLETRALEPGVYKVSLDLSTWTASVTAGVATELALEVQ
jgi:hypothetical protein